MNILQRIVTLRPKKFTRFITSGIKNTQDAHRQHTEESTKLENPAHTKVLEDESLQEYQSKNTIMEKSKGRSRKYRRDLTEYRLTHPEFLPDPNPLHRQALREKLERMDMMARRSKILIPEFYVGSILAVVYSDPHSPTKTNRFVGICIQREGCGLRASFLLRNVVDGQGVEVRYYMYDPTIQSIECLRLEKRLDAELLYLRDALPEYSTFPFDMEPVKLRDGEPVPVNTIKVALKPPPWYMKWERADLNGVQDLMPLLSQNRRNKKNVGKKPWEKYDLMKDYRATIPEEDQADIFQDIADKLDLMEKEIRSNRKMVK